MNIYANQHMSHIARVATIPIDIKQIFLLRLGIIHNL